MAEQDINQLLKVRREKLSALQEAGKDPFQITRFDQTHHSDEVRALYEEHEAKLLADRAPVNTDGMDEESAKQAINDDYNERRAIMDANPIHVSIAGRMMFKRVMGKASFCNIQDLQNNHTLISRSLILVISLVLRAMHLEQRQERFQSTLRNWPFFRNHYRFFQRSSMDLQTQIHATDSVMLTLS